jgi:hypothetical protein
VISYRDAKVYLKPGIYYRVGPLSQEWRRMRTGVKAISFYNERLKASLTTSAFCGRSASDKQITFAAGRVVDVLSARTVTDHGKFTLGGRGAMRQNVIGELDGVRVAMDLVVVRKDACVFDFYAIEPEVISPEVKSAFETFFGDFEYE